MDVLIYLTSIAIMLLIGLLISIFSDKIKISNILLLIFVGVGAGLINYRGQSLFQFPPVFLVSIATFALVMIVFDGASQMKLREIDKLSYKALKLTGVFTIINLLFVGFITYLLFFNNFTTINIILSLVFAILVTGTDPASIFVLLKNKTHKILEFLKVEAIINTPLVVLFPFILLQLIGDNPNVNFLTQLGPFIQQIVTGVGAGIVIGLVMFKFMKTTYSEQYSPLALLTTTLITYVIAENLGGNGILAVATLGLLFGNMYMKKKTKLSEFSSIFSISLEILVFILIGVVIEIPLELLFFIKSLIIYFILCLCRYLSLKLSVGKDYTHKKLVLMTLIMPKGIAVATVIFTIALLDIPGISTLVNLTLITMIYSLIAATFTTWIISSFIELKETKVEQHEINRDKINFLRSPSKKQIKKVVDEEELIN